MPVGLLPVPCPPLDEAQIPECPRLLRRVVSRPDGASEILEERARPLDVPRPPELMPEDARRAIVDRPAGQRPFEHERLFHRGGYAAPGVEVQKPVRRECAAQERGVVDTGGCEDGKLSVLRLSFDDGQAYEFTRD